MTQRLVCPNCGQDLYVRVEQSRTHIPAFLGPFGMWYERGCISEQIWLHCYCGFKQAAGRAVDNLDTREITDADTERPG